MAKRHFEIRPKQAILLEGRDFTPDDVIATVTLEDCEAGHRTLSIDDVLSYLRFSQFTLVCTDVDEEGEPSNDDGKDQADKADWYKQHEQPQDGSNADDQADDVDDDEADENEASPAPHNPSATPIDLPRTILASLAKLGVHTLEDASTFLLDSAGDTRKLNISKTAVERLLKQITAAGLPTGQPE